MEQYPDIDCVFLNAGTQQFYDLTNPEDFDVKNSKTRSTSIS